MWKVHQGGMRWPGNQHLAFFSLGFLLVLAILNLSPLDFYIYDQGHGPAEVAVKEEESEGGSGGGAPTTSPSKREMLTLLELRDAAVEALRSCSACAPHRWPLSFSNTHKSKRSQFGKKTSHTGAPGWKGKTSPPPPKMWCRISCTW